MAELANYDSKQVTITFGAYTLSGYAPDSKVTVSRNEDAFSMQIGSDGEPTRSRNNNKSGSFTVRLAQSSAYNDILSGLAAIDEVSGGSVYPMMVKDVSGTTLCAAESAWIRKYPDSEFAVEAGEREWIFDTGVLVMYVGGNV